MIYSRRGSLLQTKFFSLRKVHHVYRYYASIIDAEIPDVDYMTVEDEEFELKVLNYITPLTETFYGDLEYEDAKENTDSEDDDE